MAYSTDSDLQMILPDILDFGISSFVEEHAKAEADINRELRINWWTRTGRTGDMDTDLLTASQFSKASAYLVLWKYALTQLTNWVSGDRFMNQINYYKDRYNEEMERIFADGVEYDFNEDGVVSEDEKNITLGARLVR